MHLSTQFDSQPRAPQGGTTTSARAGSGDTAQPPLTSGFGAVMDQEEDIQSSTESYLGADHGVNSAAIDRILRHQDTRLGANIALLGQRYATLPHAARFEMLHARLHAMHPARPVGTADDAGVLPTLVAKHQDVLRKIETLIDRRPDGQRGELILAEVARNHEEMIWMLTALIKEDESVRDLIAVPVIAATPVAASLGTGEARWENEGGARRVV